MILLYSGIKLRFYLILTFIYICIIDTKTFWPIFRLFDVMDKNTLFMDKLPAIRFNKSGGFKPPVVQLLVPETLTLTFIFLLP